MQTIIYQVIHDDIMSFKLLLLLMVAGCVTRSAFLATSDNRKIAYESSIPAKATTGIILLHMLGRDHSTWNDFKDALNEEGYATISIDLRGHGKSQGNWQSFSEKDFRSMTLDVSAAASYLKQQGMKNIVVIGASIGANTALNYALTDKDVKGVALLSPGENYRGVKTFDSAAKLSTPLFVAVATGDLQSINASKKIHDLAKGKKQIKIYDCNTHGTNMFDGTDLDALLLSWLDSLS